MFRIIRPRGSGKTTELMHLAEEHDAIIVCPNPRAYEQLARTRGFNDDLMFISYDDYIRQQYNYNNKTTILIDEIDGLLAYLGGNIIGYSLSPSD